MKTLATALLAAGLLLTPIAPIQASTTTHTLSTATPTEAQPAGPCHNWFKKIGLCK